MWAEPRRRSGSAEHGIPSWQRCCLSAPGAVSSKRKSQHGSSKQPKQPRPRVEEVVAGSKRKAADARRLPKRGVAGHASLQ